ncbi:MAG: hypothetical protein JSW27_04150 [Phycisphaerales bacterium]|nr:MAG: hypothetical protein JSW27_04150 [Phycisphaerales bacterium]
MDSTFKKRLLDMERLIGTVVTIAAPDVADVLSRLGFDFLWIDAEHGALDLTQAQMLVQATAGRCSTVVRVSSQDEAWIKKALDIGCDGIVVPHVNTEEQARRIVELSFYPPVGTRSLGAARGQGYGIDLPHAIEQANEQTAVIVQAEHIKAVENIESIVKVEGVTAVLIGPYDLSGSLGVLGQVDNPQVREAVVHVAEECRKARMPVGIFAADVAAAQQALDDGVNMVAMGLDIFFLWQSANKALADLRETAWE